MATATTATSPESAPPEEDLDSRSANNLLLAAVLALTALRLAIASYTGLVDDEAYYRIWSLAPALSYLDHPPMVAWIIGAGRAIAGDTSLGVRLLAPVIVLAGAAILWRTAELLYGPVIARRAVWIMLAMPLLAIGGIIVTPDLPSVLFAGLVDLGAGRTRPQPKSQMVAGYRPFRRSRPSVEIYQPLSRRDHRRLAPCAAGKSQMVSHPGALGRRPHRRRRRKPRCHLERRTRLGFIYEAVRTRRP